MYLEQTIALLEKRVTELEYRLRVRALGTDMRSRFMEIIEVVAEHFAVEPKELLARNRQYPYAEARILVVHIAYDRVTKHKGLLGRYLSRTHAAIVHAIRTSQGRAEVDEKYRTLIATLTAKLEPADLTQPEYIPATRTPKSTPVPSVPAVI